MLLQRHIYALKDRTDTIRNDPTRFIMRQLVLQEPKQLYYLT